MPRKDQITNAEARPIKTPELHDFLAHWLHRLSGSVLRTFEGKLKEFGITEAQWVILCTIYRGNADTPRTIADYIGVDSGSVSRSVDRLVAKNMLRKVPHEEDGRSITLALTPAQIPVIETLMLVACEQEQDWRSALTNQEMRTFASLMEKLLEHQNVTPGGRFW